MICFRKEIPLNFKVLGKLLIMNLIIDCSQLINLKFVFFWMAK